MKVYMVRYTTSVFVTDKPFYKKPTATWKGAWNYADNSNCLELPGYFADCVAKHFNLELHEPKEIDL